MYKAKLSKSIYFASVLFLLFAVFVWYFGVDFILTDEILMEDDAVMDPTTKTFLGTAFIIIPISWFISSIVLFRQCFKNRAFVINEDGICDGYTMSFILAFFVAARIKCIPWTAIKSIEVTHKGIVRAKVDVSKVQAGAIAKLLLKMGYVFSFSSAKEKKDELLTVL